MLLTTLGIASVVFVAAFTWRTVTKTGGDVAARREAIIEAWVNIFIGFGINFIVNMVLLPMMTQGGRVDPVANFWGGWVYTAVSVLRQYAIRRWFDTRLQAFNKRASIALGKISMSNKGDAYALATAIYAGTKGGSLPDDLDERIHHAVNGIGLGSDEHRADLYAQLAETLTETTRFEDAVLICQGAIANTRKYG